MWLVVAATFPAEAKAEVSVVRVSSPVWEYGSSGWPMKALETCSGPLPERDPVWKNAWKDARRPVGKVVLRCNHKFRI